MTTSESQTKQRLPWYTRLTIAAMGVVLISMLGVAVWLKPSPRGFGTHTQLGLQPCTFTQLARIRCPSCGMTTSWAHTVRGQLFSAVKANSGGTLLALLALVGGPWLLLSGVLGKWFCGRPNEWLVVALAAFVVIVTLTDWGIRLGMGPLGR
ncbi:MAG: DUF2752 domain-containing protein [Planctomycetales bacterium]|nr:DUF2752 domain-containing protein [Planctomycetales bacterium]